MAALATPVNQIIYRDMDFRFIPHPVTGRLAILKNSDSVKQAVKLLVLTSLGERPFRPNLGSLVRSHMFENFTRSTVADIRFSIQNAIRNKEPRVEILDVGVIGLPDSNAVRVNVVFRPINSNDPAQVEFTIERVR